MSLEMDRDALRESQIEQDEQQVDNWFTYHSPTAKQMGKYTELREAARVFARTLITVMPDRSPDRSVAIRKIREAVMTANAGIACGS